MNLAQDLRRLLIAAAWITGVVVAVIAATSPLPSDAQAAWATIGVLVVGLGLWFAALLPQVTSAVSLGLFLFGVGAAGAALQVLDPDGPGFMLAYMAVAAIGLALPRRTAIRVAAVVIVLAAVAEGWVSPHPVAAAVSLAAGCAALFLSTLLASASREAHVQSEALLEQRTAAEAARAESTVLAERQHLARELHDVLAHTLSGLAVQLEGARLLAEKTGADPRLVDQVTLAGRLAREGIRNAKRAVATLRGDEMPGPSAIPTLVKQARLTGLPVTVTVHGGPRPLSTEAGLAVYRTVQEALTNTAKYAGTGAVAEVSLTWTDTVLTVEVLDRGGDGTDAGLPSGGYGLTGLSERAALAGGLLDAGPTGEGWRVTLAMPLTGSRTAAAAPDPAGHPERAGHPKPAGSAPSNNVPAPATTDERPA